jgi:hypothetical protein
VKTVSWFSAGVSSAVATKLLIEQIDEIIYIHIDDHHPDTFRFVGQCEKWFGKPIKRIQSEYKDVETACLMSGGRGYINGPSGAACTKFLKKRVRKIWEQDQSEEITYVWGMDYTEKNRADRLFETMPEFEHVFPLIDQKISKEASHQMLKASGIKRPAMYDMGYNNNNCIGCVKGGMGYWNAIRRDWPDMFDARARMERKIEATCIKGVYLDELDPMAGRHTPPVVEDCGILCEVMKL